MIAIRTNANGTLGHLMRMRHLAGALAERGHRCRFLLDTMPDASMPSWVQGLDIVALYAGGDGRDDIDARDDAARCIESLRGEPIRLVIVDDYRLERVWETALHAEGYDIAVFDDTARSHVCDLLVESGLAPRSATSEIRPGGARLAGLPYVLLDPVYARGPRSATERCHDIVISLGGGGDMRLVARITEQLLARAADLPEAFRLRPIIGPVARDAAAVLELAARHPDRVLPVERPESLYEVFATSALYIGAAGTALYELAALEVPAVTFSLAPNQVNAHASLERLGHYLHLNDFATTDVPELAILAARILTARERIKALRRSGPERVDGRGAERVADIIDHWLATGAMPDMPRELPVEGAAPGASETRIQLGADEAVVACDDRDINRYLDARNLAVNADRMTTVAAIRRLAHYRWWFESRRLSYRVIAGDRTLLYVWFEPVDVAGYRCLIGGWFVDEPGPSPLTILSAHQWLMRHCDDAYPDRTWIAVIHHDNRFVRAMNERDGFRHVEAGEPLAAVLREAFPAADERRFSHMVREPQAIRRSVA